VYECIRTLTTIHPSPVLMAGAAESVSRFLGARENNLKYAGIDALTRLVRIDPKYAQVSGVWAHERAGLEGGC
jgi:AP-4 complex subunit epsilon-1